MLACDAPTTTIRTEVFDGPLELLLYLVRREGVDIRTVAIAPIADAYLAQVELMEMLDLDVAGEFLVMAATLCQIKSRELLPRNERDSEQEPDDDDLRLELHRKLVEYQRYRDAAEELAASPWLDRDVFTRPQSPLDAREQPVDPGTDADGLLAVFEEILTRRTARPPVHEVERATYSLRDVAQWVVKHIAKGPIEMSQLLQAMERKPDRVLVFIAALELARLGALDVEQSHHLGAIILRHADRATEADLNLLSEGA